MDALQLLALFGIGAVAGLINVMAGGGSALTLPVLIFFGLEGTVANGTNRIAIFVQNIFAVQSFHQQKKRDFRTSLSMAIWTLPGGIAGVILAVNISNAWFEYILGIVLIGVVISMIAAPGVRRSAERSTLPRWLIYPAMFLIGFYGGFIQVGVGFLIMAALFHILKTDLVSVNMHKVFIVLVYTLPVLAIFVYTGNVDWAKGLALAAGNSFGGWWSARLAVRKGERLVRIVLFVAIVLMALRLLDIL